MSAGFIMVNRKFFDHKFWSEKRVFSYAEAWLDLIRLANWEDGQRIVRGKLLPVRRGEVIASLRFLGTAWQWSPMKVSRFVEWLKNETMATVETRQGETFITLCNYDQYNSPESVDET